MAGSPRRALASVALLTSVVGLGATPAVAAPPTQRVAGNDRYETAVELSKLNYPGGAGKVVITTGENWPDAISAGPLAAALKAPLLLATRGGVPASTMAEVQRLRPGGIYVVGGEAVLPPVVVEQLSAVAPVERLAGPDRYATSAVVATYAQAALEATSGGGVLEVVIVPGDGDHFGWAAFGAGAASASGEIVILMPSAAVTPDVVIAFFQLNGPYPYATIVAPGGAVDSISTQIRNSPVPVLEILPAIEGASDLVGYASLFWATRFLVTMDVIPELPDIRPDQGLYLTTAVNWPDALTVSAYANPRNIVLPVGACLDPAQVVLIEELFAPPRVFVVGGHAALPPSVDSLTPCL